MIDEKTVESEVNQGVETQNYDYVKEKNDDELNQYFLTAEPKLKELKGKVDSQEAKRQEVESEYETKWKPFIDGTAVPTDEERAEYPAFLERYNTIYQDYQKDVDEYNALFGEYKAHADEDELRYNEAQKILNEAYVPDGKRDAEAAMREGYNGNVDLLNRPVIDAYELTKAGWDGNPDKPGEGTATVYTSQFEVTDKGGQTHSVLVTPIKKDGSVMSPAELEEYVKTLGGNDDILKADKQGLVIAVDSDDDGQRLHELQEQYYKELEYDELMKMAAVTDDDINALGSRTERAKAAKGREWAAQRVNEMVEEEAKASYDYSGKTDEELGEIIGRSEAYINGITDPMEKAKAISEYNSAVTEAGRREYGRQVAPKAVHEGYKAAQSSGIQLPDAGEMEGAVANNMVVYTDALRRYRGSTTEALVNLMTDLLDPTAETRYRMTSGQRLATIAALSKCYAAANGDGSDRTPGEEVIRAWVMDDAAYRETGGEVDYDWGQINKRKAIIESFTKPGSANESTRHLNQPQVQVGRYLSDKLNKGVAEAKELWGDDWMSHFDFGKYTEEAVNSVDPDVVTGYILSIANEHNLSVEQATQVYQQGLDREIQEAMVGALGRPSNDLEYLGLKLLTQNWVTSLGAAISRWTGGTPDGYITALDVSQMALGDYEKTAHWGTVAIGNAGVLVADAYTGGFKLAGMAERGALEVLGGTAVTAAERAVGEQAVKAYLRRMVASAANFATYTTQQYVIGSGAAGQKITAGGIAQSAGHGAIDGLLLGMFNVAAGRYGDKVLWNGKTKWGWNPATMKFAVPSVEVAKIAGEGLLFSTFSAVREGGYTAQNVGDSFGMVLAMRIMHGKQFMRTCRERIKGNPNAYGKMIPIGAEEAEALRKTGYGNMAQLLTAENRKQLEGLFNGWNDEAGEGLQQEFKKMGDDKNVPWWIYEKAVYTMTGGKAQLVNPYVGVQRDDNEDGTVTFVTRSADGREIGRFTVKGSVADKTGAGLDSGAAQNVAIIAETAYRESVKRTIEKGAREEAAKELQGDWTEDKVANSLAQWQEADAKVSELEKKKKLTDEEKAELEDARRKRDTFSVVYDKYKEKLDKAVLPATGFSGIVDAIEQKYNVNLVEAANTRNTLTQNEREALAAYSVALKRAGEMLERGEKVDVAKAVAEVEEGQGIVIGAEAERKAEEEVALPTQQTEQPKVEETPKTEEPKAEVETPVETETPKEEEPAVEPEEKVVTEEETPAVETEKVEPKADSEAEPQTAETAPAVEEPKVETEQPKVEEPVSEKVEAPTEEKPKVDGETVVTDEDVTEFAKESGWNFDINDLAAEDRDEVKAALQEQRKAAHDYAAGRTEEKPAQWEFWKKRDGLQEPEKKDNTVADAMAMANDEQSSDVLKEAAEDELAANGVTRASELPKNGGATAAPQEPAEPTEEPKTEAATESQPAEQKEEAAGIDEADREWWKRRDRNGIVSALDAVAKKRGLKIRTYVGDPGVNGETDYANNTIWVNKKSPKALSFVLGHELTHYMDQKGEKAGSSVYKDYKKLAMDYLKKAGKYEDELARQHKLYSESEKSKDYFNGLTLDGQVSYLEDELACDLAGNMLGDVRTAREIFGLETDRTKLEAARDAVLDFFDKVLVKTGNKQAVARQAMKKMFDELLLERDVAKAVAETAGGTSFDDGDNGGPRKRQSVSGNAEGCGFDVFDTETVIDDEGNERLVRKPIIDKEGNVCFRMGDKVFNANNLITAKDIKDNANSALNFMMADALDYGTITKRQAEKIYRKYADMLNSYLVAGKGKDGESGFGNLEKNWLWLGETVFRTVATNSDAQYSYSLDITRVCKKNEAVIKAISAEQVKCGYGITPAQILDIYLTADKDGYQVPCPVCYVFSRYISNGQFATSLVSAMRRYGDFMPGQPGAWSLERWVQELTDRKADRTKYSKILKSAKEDVKINLNEIDKLSKLITSGKLSEEEMAHAKALIAKYDARYRAALNVVSQESLDRFIETFVLEEKDGEYRFREDAAKPADMDDFVRHALDIRLTASASSKYPAIGRYNRKGGAAQGKEISFASNNDIGDVAMGLGIAKDKVRDYTNWYKQAAEATDPKEREEYLKAARRRFEGAAKYVKRQTLRGGQRMWSWSDNIESLSSDVASNLMQLEMLGGALQTYSKQLEGVELVAAMKGYVNASLMGYGNGWKEIPASGVEERDGKLAIKEDLYDIDAKGRTRLLAKAGSPVYSEGGKHYTLAFDDIVGIAAYGKDGKRGLFDLNAMYDRAGNILVGMNDIHVRAAMADNRIFFIIPWHASGMSNHILTQMMNALGIRTGDFKGTDYTNMQEERDHLAKNDKGKYKHPVTKGTIEVWESHNYETQFACGLGHIKSGDGKGFLSKGQLKYRELRNAIFDGKYDELSAADKKAIQSDEFLSQVYRKVLEGVVDSGVLGEKDAWMTSDDKSYIYPYEYWDEGSKFNYIDENGKVINTADVNGKRYAEYCRRLGFTPKFSGEYDKKTGERKTESGNFIDDPGYWKLLIDRRMYDRLGEFQDLTPIESDGLESRMYDPAKTGELYDVTKVADDAGAERIADEVYKMETERTGTMPQVDYGLTLEQASERYAEVKKANEYNKADKALQARLNPDTDFVPMNKRQSLNEREEKRDSEDEASTELQRAAARAVLNREERRMSLVGERGAVNRRVRDVLVERMRSAGIEVITDEKEAKRVLSAAKRAEEALREMRGWHGSGADFNAFDLGFALTGEGAMVYGHGVYETDVKDIGEGYAEQAQRNFDGKFTYKGKEIGSLKESKGLFKENDPAATAKVLFLQEVAEAQHRDYLKGTDYEVDLVIDKYYDEIDRRKRLYEDRLSVLLERTQYTAQELLDYEPPMTPEYERDMREMEQVEKRLEEAISLEVFIKDEFKIEDLLANTDEARPAILYEVELPDNDGGNYLSWDMPLPKSHLRRVADSIRRLSDDLRRRNQYSPNRRSSDFEQLAKNVESSQYTGKDIVNELSKVMLQKTVSDVLSDAGFVGIEYPANYRAGGNREGAKNHVIFKEGDIKIVSKTHLYRNESGEVYGFVRDGKIYLDPRVATSETAIHEYSHLWGEMLRSKSPEEWEQLKVELEGDAETMDVVKRLYPELEGDEFMDEVFARFSGKRGSERLRLQQELLTSQVESQIEKGKIARAFDKLRTVLGHYWAKVREMISGKARGVEHRRAEDFADMALNDLLSGVNPTMRGGERISLDEVRESGATVDGGEGVRGDASQYETTSADGRRLSLNGDREERKALRESEESRKLFEATKKKFGTTKDINEAGYILPDGTMLDFSGRHWMDEGADTSHLAGSRAVDHREISDVGYDKDENETGFKTDMSDFINRGAIRVHRSGNYSRINLSMEPTAEQMKVLRRFAAGVDDVDVDFGDGNHTDHFAEYEDARPSRVLGDIDRYFTEGIMPSGSRRYSLNGGEARYSLEDAEGLHRIGEMKRDRLRELEDEMAQLRQRDPLEPGVMGARVKAGRAIAAMRRDLDEFDRLEAMVEQYNSEAAKRPAAREWAQGGAVDLGTTAREAGEAFEAIGNATNQKERTTAQAKYAVAMTRLQQMTDTPPDMGDFVSVAKPERPEMPDNVAYEEGRGYVPVPEDSTPESVSLAEDAVRQHMQDLNTFHQAYAEWEQQMNAYEAKYNEWKDRQREYRFRIAENQAKLRAIEQGEKWEADTYAEEGRVSDAIAAGRGVQLDKHEASSMLQSMRYEHRRVLEHAAGEDLRIIAGLEDKIREALGIKDTTISKAANNKKMKQTLRDLIDMVEGTKETPEELKEVVRLIHGYFDDLYNWQVSHGLAQGRREDYVTHIWDLEKSTPDEELAARFGGIANVRTANPYMLQREVPTYAEGREHGLVPKYDSILDIMRHYAHIANEAVATKRYLDMLKYIKAEATINGETVYVPLIIEAGDPTYGLRYDAIRNSAFYRDGQPEYFILHDDKGKVQHEVETTLGTDNQTSKGVELFDKATNLAKSSVLKLSLFHHGALTEHFLGLYNLNRGGVFHSLWDVSKLLYNVMLRGKTQAKVDPELTERAMSHFVRLGVSGDYKDNKSRDLLGMMGDFLTSLDKSDPIGNMAKLVSKGNDKLLWDVLHDGFKLLTYREMERRIMNEAKRKGWNKARVSRELDEAGMTINNMFGGQHFDLLNQSQDAMRWYRRIFLSPDWNVSWPRLFGNMAGLGRLHHYDGGYLKGQNLVGKNREGKIAQKGAASMWVNSAAVVFSIMSFINWVNRRDDEEKQYALAQMYRGGYTDENGVYHEPNPDYKSPYEQIPGYIKAEDVKSVSDAIHYLNQYALTPYNSFNDPGKNTYLFVGRDEKNRSRYVRFGKQMREGWALLFNHYDELDPFAWWSEALNKTNPFLGTIYELGTGHKLSGFENKALKEAHGADKWIEYGKVLANSFMPWSLSRGVQSDDFSAWDLAFPGSKGPSAYKAREMMVRAIENGDEERVQEWRVACVMNGLDWQKIEKQARDQVKRKSEEYQGIENLQTPGEVIAMMDSTQDYTTKKALERRYKELTTDENKYVDLTAEEAADEFKGKRDEFTRRYSAIRTGRDFEEDVAIEKTTNIAEAEGGVATEFRALGGKFSVSKGYCEAKSKKDSGKCNDYFDAHPWEMRTYLRLAMYNDWLGRQRKRLNGDRMNDDAVMASIRAQRTAALRDVDKLQRHENLNWDEVARATNSNKKE